MVTGAGMHVVGAMQPTARGATLWTSPFSGNELPAGNRRGVGETGRIPCMVAPGGEIRPQLAVLKRTGVAAVNGPGVDQTPEGVQEHLHLPRASRRRHPPDLGRGGRRSPLGAGEATGLVPTLSTRDALG